jgi:hypothetical protein
MASHYTNISTNFLRPFLYPYLLWSEECLERICRARIHVNDARSRKVQPLLKTVC